MVIKADTPASPPIVERVARRAKRALAQRLAEVGQAMVENPSEGAVQDPFALLLSYVESLQAAPDMHRTWLLLTAVSASFPRAEVVREAHRRISHKTPRDATIWLLRSSASTMTSSDALAEIVLIDDRAVVDVDFSAQQDMLTGIQRVVRNVVPRWSGEKRLTLAKWVDQKMLASLTEEEARRVGAPSAPGVRAGAPRRLVPWCVPVLLPEVPFAGHGDRLSSLARYSSNSVRVIGYDCIPAVSGELVDDVERQKFANYLELVKYVDLVVAISDTAAAEFTGFASALRAQGLVGPVVKTCPLPTTIMITPATQGNSRSGGALVLCVGTLDDRKNQIAVVEAAEHLWRMGLNFRLRLVGGTRPRSKDLLELVAVLREAGRPVVVAEQPVTDGDLDEAYREARVVVFPTLHEGFGLPVVEALSYGIPVITSDFGSTREVGEGSGALLVDPEDVAALTDNLRLLLTDTTVHGKLVDQARARPRRDWDDYAAELWDEFSS